MLKGATPRSDTDTKDSENADQVQQEESTKEQSQPNGNESSTTKESEDQRASTPDCSDACVSSQTMRLHLVLL